jgi:hypothetical protein
VTGSYEHNNKPPVSTECYEYDQLNDYKLLMELIYITTIFQLHTTENYELGMMWK